MPTVNEDMDLVRSELIGALHDQLTGSLGVAEITALVDVALEKAAVRTLLETAVSGAVTITEWQATNPTPPPAVVAAQDTYDTHVGGAREFYASIP